MESTVPLGYVFMLMHAVQFALQPLLTTVQTTYVAPSKLMSFLQWAVGGECIKFTLVLVCELMKV